MAPWRICTNGRRIQTKLLVLITVIDDIYDAYGTLEELELFTEAIERYEVQISLR